MPDFPLFDLAPAVYWLRGVFPFDLLALFVVMLFVFWTAAGAAWFVGMIFSWSLASSLRSTSSANTSNRAPKEGRL
ncbi:hypothetical protein AB9L11_11770 [Desulfovibrio piger]